MLIDSPSSSAISARLYPSTAYSRISCSRWVSSPKTLVRSSAVAEPAISRSTWWSSSGGTEDRPEADARIAAASEW